MQLKDVKPGQFFKFDKNGEVTMMCFNKSFNEIIILTFENINIMNTINTNKNPQYLEANIFLVNASIVGGAN
jgi:hypothetical protein